MTSKLELRPTLEIIQLENSTVAENFQNQTLRPILKLQNDLYLKLFANYATRQKTDFESLSNHKKSLFVEHSLQKDLVLKNTFLGITIGMFTSEELEHYISDAKSYNRRIVTMLIERVKNQM